MGQTVEISIKSSKSINMENKLTLILIIALSGFFANTMLVQGQTLPGVELAYSEPSTETYLGAPSIVKIDDGTYVASHQFFGPGSCKCRTSIYQSKDRGQTWNRLTIIRGQFWSNMFVWKSDLYIMGVSEQYGDLIIRKSTDGGRSWTEPTNSTSGLLRDDVEYHTAPVPVVVHNGRIWRAVEDRFPPEKWGVNFRAFVISAPVDSDLLNAASWTTSNRIRYNQDWPGNAWLEGNVVVNPDGKLVNILRNNYQPVGGRAAILDVSTYGETVSFDPDTGFIDLPGGMKKFTIRYDGVTNKYWALSNYVPDEFAGGNPERTRNTLALISSNDLREWEVNRIVLQHPNVEKVGFQYADWQFDGDDIISLIRTAYPNEQGVHADNQHNANYIMFKRVSDFRDN